MSEKDTGAPVVSPLVIDNTHYTLIGDVVHIATYSNGREIYLNPQEVRGFLQFIEKIKDAI